MLLTPVVARANSTRSVLLWARAAFGSAHRWASRMAQISRRTEMMKSQHANPPASCYICQMRNCNAVLCGGSRASSAEDGTRPGRPTSSALANQGSETQSRSGCRQVPARSRHMKIFPPYEHEYMYHSTSTTNHHHHSPHPSTKSLHQSIHPSAPSVAPAARCNHRQHSARHFSHIRLFASPVTAISTASLCAHYGRGRPANQLQCRTLTSPPVGRGNPPKR